MRKTILILAALAGLALRADAEVVRIDVGNRVDVGTSGYEKIIAGIHFAIDPADARNRRIVDLDKAPTNAQHRVEFDADLYILRPKDAARSNGVALVEVSNRGNKSLLSTFNRATSGGRDPSTDADLGDGFLTKQGFTLVWVGWQFDVPARDLAMTLKAPIANGLSGVVRVEFTPNDNSAETTIADLAGYAALDPAAADSVLTVRDGPYGKAEEIARNRWTLKGTTLTLAGGFAPGRTYQLGVHANNLPVTGVGLAAFRDTTSWLKYGGTLTSNSGGAALNVGPMRHAIAFGSSQSGRFLRTFMYYGFNTDEKGRKVYDGVMAHIAGAARLSINERTATPNGLAMFTATGFPFSDRAQRDPISGKTEGLLENERARENQPDIFYTNTAVEYWGGGRSAALIHTTPDGRSDITPPPNVRIYFLTGAQHSPARFPARISTGQQPDNPLEYAWTLRALLTAMDRWVRQGTVPPASQYPRLSDESLVRADAIGFPAIPGVQSPRTLVGGRQGEAMLPFLVPKVDEDGNEITGVRTPEQAVPVATYTGWNFRNKSVGGTSQLVSLLGSSIAFPRTQADRTRTGDPRRSIEERYPSRDRYLTLARARADQLVKGGYLLTGDVAQVLKRIEDLWAGPAPSTGQ